MSIYTSLNWPIVDKAAVCALQDVASAGAVLLNGTLFNPNIPNQISFITAGFIRSVSLSSINDLSGRSFVISGFQNGAFVTENIAAGPNNNTVFGVKSYDYITSVTVNGSVSGISVGTGNSGYLPLLIVNSSTTAINYSVSILLPTSGSGITYSLWQTLDQINFNFISFADQATHLFPSFGLTNQTTSQLATSQNVTNFVLLQVNNSTNPLTTDTFDFVFLQA